MSHDYTRTVADRLLILITAGCLLVALIARVAVDCGVASAQAPTSELSSAAIPGPRAPGCAYECCKADGAYAPFGYRCPNDPQ